MCFNLTADVILPKGLKRGIRGLKLKYFTQHKSELLFKVVYLLDINHIYIQNDQRKQLLTAARPHLRV